MRLIQLSDPHIFSDPGEDFGGVNTADTLCRVIRRVRAKETSAAAVVVTGDLVHEPCEGAYQRLRGYLRELPLPVYCLPGNHDDPEVMGRVLPGENIHVTDSEAFGDWLVIFLNSRVANTHIGHLDEQALSALAAALAKMAHGYALVCVHHPPVVIDSPWMDAMRLENAEALFEVLDRFDNVRGVIWGHIHQAFSAARNGVKLLGAPSTCIQFLPKTEHFVKDTLGPGYRWLRLDTDGSLSSGIVRV